jgi:ribosomal protein S12 methylthiotransferase accessory factor YcaO
LEFVDEDDYTNIDQGDVLKLSAIHNALQRMLAEGTPIMLHNVTKGIDIPLVARITARQHELLTYGGLLNHTKR